MPYRDKERLNQYMHQYYEKNRDRLLKKQHEYNLTHKQVRTYQNHKLYFKCKYDLTLENINQIRLNQNNKCASCGKELIKFVIDHNHVTGEIRGILCYGCNVIIGVLEIYRDSVQSHYLQRFK